MLHFDLTSLALNDDKDCDGRNDQCDCNETNNEAPYFCHNIHLIIAKQRLKMVNLSVLFFRIILEVASFHNDQDISKQCARQKQRHCAEIGYSDSLVILLIVSDFLSFLFYSEFVIALISAQDCLTFNHFDFRVKVPVNQQSEV